MYLNYYQNANKLITETPKMRPNASMGVKGNQINNFLILDAFLERFLKISLCVCIYFKADTYCRKIGIGNQTDDLPKDNKSYMVIDLDTTVLGM